MKAQHQTIQFDDCWNRIGIWRHHADPCPKLEEVIHCRNCTIYKSAGAMLLNREVDEEYKDNNTSTYSQSPQTNTSNAASRMIFRASNEWYAIKTAILSEVCEMKEIHSIPHNKSNQLRGLVNIRGELEMIISVFGIDSTTLEQNSIARLIVIELDSGKYVIPVDEVMGVYRIDDATTKQPPASVAASQHKLVTGVANLNGKHIGIVDADAIDALLEEY